MSPRSSAASSVGTSCRAMPMMRAHTRSASCGEPDASSTPTGRGVPAVGPLPSIATTPSTMDSAGRKYSSISTSIRPNVRSSGYLKWYSGFIVPGMTPNIFFAAADIPIMPWLLSLQKSMIASQSSSHAV